MKIDLYKIKKVLKENWWKIIKQICAGLIALLTLILLYQANVMVNYSNELYKKELYPHFRVTESIENKNEDGDYADCIIRIRNYGGNFYSLSSSTATYIPLKMNDEIYMMPCNGYYFVSVSYPSGDIVREHFYQNNNLKIANLVIEANRRLSNEEDIMFYDGPITYVKVAYQDVFGVDETKYFLARNSTIIDKKQGEQYVDGFSPFYNLNDKHYTFDIDEITGDLFYEFATTDLKNAFLVKE